MEGVWTVLAVQVAISGLVSFRFFGFLRLRRGGWSGAFVGTSYASVQVLAGKGFESSVAKLRVLGIQGSSVRSEVPCT